MSASWPRRDREAGRQDWAWRPHLPQELVADVLTVSTIPGLPPAQHYGLTIAENELNPVERQAMGGR